MGLLFRCKGIEPHSFIQINIETLQPMQFIDYVNDDKRKYFQIENGPNDIQYDDDEKVQSQVLDLSEFENEEEKEDPNKIIEGHDQRSDEQKANDLKLNEIGNNILKQRQEKRKELKIKKLEEQKQNDLNQQKDKELQIKQRREEESETPTDA